MTGDYWVSLPEGDQKAAVYRALNDHRPLTFAEAMDFGVTGWNLVCARCGSWGASWVQNQPRPGNSLALCPLHRTELARMLAAVDRFRVEAFKQPSPTEVTRLRDEYRAKRHPKKRSAGRSSRRASPD